MRSSGGAPTSELGNRPRSERAVARALLGLGPTTKALLVAATGLSRPTVQSALERLETGGLVEEAEDASATSTVGRKPHVYRLSARAGVAVGVEVGRRHVQAVVLDAGYRKVLDVPHEEVEASADENPLAVLDQVAKIVRRILSEADPTLPLLGIGLGVPMPVTTEGRIGSDTLLPAWKDVHVAREMGDRLSGAQILVANESSLGALGEATFGIRKGAESLVYVKLGTGIGAGLILGGRIHRGAGGTAGELGHTSVNHRGETCPCGNRGCLELYAGGRALLQNASDAGLDLAGIPDLVARAVAGDPGCHRIITEAAMVIGSALGTLVNLVGPQRILLGGSLSAAGGILQTPLEMTLRQSALRPAVAALTVEPASLGRLASAWGAVALVVDQVARAMPAR